MHYNKILTQKYQFSVVFTTNRHVHCNYYLDKKNNVKEKYVCIERGIRGMSAVVRDRQPARKTIPFPSPVYQCFIEFR